MPENDVLKQIKMVQQLLFATNNPHKVQEIQKAIGSHLQVISLKDAGIDKEIPEPYDTLEENATAKSTTIYELKGINCFSEDTGLEVEALNGRPGVKSARYAGSQGNDIDNIKKLLKEMEGVQQRDARFRTVISLIMEGKEYQFEGICKGAILQLPEGTAGFGYDPIFVPEGADKSFATMSQEEKNRYSHRKKAAEKLVAFLQKAENK